jgi:hypothetical protein
MTDDVSMSSLDDTVKVLRDQSEIHDVLVRYGFAADNGDADGAAASYTAAAVYEADDLVFEGRDGIRELISGDINLRNVQNGCAHTVGPVVISVDGDRGAAVGYSRVYVRRGEEIVLFRAAVNRWDMERTDGRWLIARRVSYALGSHRARAVLADASAAPGDDSAL